MKCSITTIMAILIGASSSMVAASPLHPTGAGITFATPSTTTFLPMPTCHDCVVAEVTPMAATKASTCLDAVSTVVIVGSAGTPLWSITDVAVITPAPSLVNKNYKVAPTFSSHQLSSSVSTFPTPVPVASDAFGYFQYKCSLKCDEEEGCFSWFVSSETNAQGDSTLSCVYYNALLNSSDFVAVPATLTGMDLGFGTGPLCSAAS